MFNNLFAGGNPGTPRSENPNRPGQSGRTNPKPNQTEHKYESQNEKDVKTGAKIALSINGAYVEELLKNPQELNKMMKNVLNGFDKLGKGVGLYGAYDSYVNFSANPTTAGLIKLVVDAGSIGLGPWSGLALTMLDVSGATTSTYQFLGSQIDQTCDCNFGLDTYNYLNLGEFNNSFKDINFLQ